MRRVLHLVRGTGEPLATLPPGVVADRDWVVYIPSLQLAPTGAPPLSPGPLDHDQLLVLVLAADLVLTW